METPIIDLLYKALARLAEQPKTRETALAMTKVEEAILWWKCSEQRAFEAATGAAAGG